MLRRGVEVALMLDLGDKTKIYYAFTIFFINPNCIDLSFCIKCLARISQVGSALELLLNQRLSIIKNK